MKIKWVSLILLLATIAGCSVINDHSRTLKLEDSIHLGYLDSWILPNDWVFIQDRYGDTKVITYNLDEEMITYLSLPNLGFAPFVKVSQSHTKIGYTDNENNLRIMDLSNNEILYTLETHEGQPFEFSPDEDKFAAWIDTKIFLVDITKGTLQQIYDDEEKTFNPRLIGYSLAWRPETEYIAIILNYKYDRENLPNEPDSEIILLDTTTGEYSSIQSVPTWIRTITWSPNGQFLAYAYGSYSDHFGLKIVDVTNDCTVFDDIKYDSMTDAFWSPDGKRILYFSLTSVEFLDIEEYFGVPYEELSCRD